MKHQTWYPEATDSDGSVIGKALNVTADDAAAAILATGVFDDVWSNDREVNRAWRNGTPNQTGRS